ncbi:hypothetical protein L0F63_006227 [Massospora cicadina]|nr:hypothetical protein L0F63_006227 [Massospora cicadina]
MKTSILPQLEGEGSVAPQCAQVLPTPISVQPAALLNLTTKHQVGPHVETLQLVHYDAFFKRDLTGYLPKLTTLVIHKFCNFDEPFEIPFRNFLSSVQGTLKHFNP